MKGKFRLTVLVMACVLLIGAVTPAYAESEVVYISDLRATTITADSVTLAWTPQPDTESIKLRRSNDGGKTWADAINLRVDASSVTVRGLTPNTSYSFDLEGKCSCQKLISNNAHITTKSAPVLPQPQAPTVQESNTGELAGVRAAANGAVLSSGSYISSEMLVGGRTFTKLTVNKAALGEALKLINSNEEGQQQISIEAETAGEGLVVYYPADLLASANNPNVVLAVGFGPAAYELPLARLLAGGQLQQIAGSVEQAYVTIAISTVDAETAAKLAADAAKAGLTPVSGAYQFNVAAEAGDRSQPFNHYGTSYVNRSIDLHAGVTAADATAVQYDPATGVFTFIPAVFTSADGKVTADMKHTGNRIYTVVKGQKTFADITNHWARPDIERLASMLVINGVQADAFAPNANITRAEFAALLVRALGLDSSKQLQTGFADVSETRWYAGAVAAAVEAGLIRGFEDGTFKPEAEITRAQMTVMIAAALEAAGKKVDLTGKEASVLADYKDAAKIGSWAESAAAKAVLTGIVTGVTKDEFGPQEQATRAQSAVMLSRLMKYIGFINP
ncbi:S-layer homology domain-containing protein [Paenibacillus sambharensis]|uniref:S-layer homology domain-containing protein n=1 Tax=Paenibacillus sambharensis TaxID=1803190 RepID=UPI0011B4761E|nr:S-layer homology domain-containing protein [Paenibacillus sambharensis]